MKVFLDLLFVLTFLAAAEAIAQPAAWSDMGTPSKDLIKRKGGGGGGGHGGGGEGGGGEGGGGEGGGSSGGNSGGGTGNRGPGSPGSNRGGSTTTGSGDRPMYGSGGQYYGGGASVPYASGVRSPGGITPLYYRPGGLGFYPGIWFYGAWAYPYGHPYGYYNETSHMNESRPVECFCAEYAECGCDSNNDTAYINSVANNNTIATVADVNGTDTLLINGTLNNGTTAPGGTASPNAASRLRQGLLETSGWWVIVAGVAYAVSFL